MNDRQFREKVLLKKSKLYRYALRILGNEEDAEDATSEAILLLWMKRKQLLRCDYLDRYLYTVVKNISINSIRNRKSMEPLQDHLYTVTDDLPGNPGPQTKFEKVNKIINRLPENQRTAIHLRMTEGYTMRQIADIMNVKVNTVEVTLSRARKKIREEYAK